MDIKQLALTGRGNGHHPSAMSQFHREDSGRILVDVHQVVRDLAGTVLSISTLSLLSMT